MERGAKSALELGIGTGRVALPLQERGVQLYPVKLRYIWPSEMDLMARLAGLERKHRWGSWTKEEVTAESEKHISVYARAG